MKVNKKGTCKQCSKKKDLLWWLGVPVCEVCFGAESMPPIIKEIFLNKG